MKDLWVADLASRENRDITGFFAVAAKQVRTGRDGGRYFALTLCDRAGSIDARMWDITEAGEFAAGDVVKVRGQVCRYNEKLQIKVERIRQAQPNEYELGDFVPQSQRNIEEMWAELQDWVASFRDPDLQALVQAFLEDPAVAQALRQAPAAKGMHHAWIGGLLEHVLSLMGLCDSVARRYPQINRDLLLTGVALHDIGKLRELAWGTSFEYTLEGQLLGHITIGIRMIGEKIAALPAFPPAKRLLVEHLVLSHHGRYEFGSPRLPMTPEAIMLHYLDDLDAKMQTVSNEFARSEANGRPAAELTDWVRSLERPLLNTAAYLETEEMRALATSPVPAESPQPPAPEVNPERKVEDRNHALPFED